jgi:hypothetical protein
MFPIMLDLSTLPLILVGSGPRTLRRLSLLDADRAARRDPPGRERHRAHEGESKQYYECLLH